MSLSTLPLELVDKIIDCLAERDRLSLSLVSKGLRNSYRFRGDRDYAFNLQGHTDTMFKEGIRVLLKTDVPISELKVAKFNLKQSFNDKISLTDCRKLECVTKLTFEECVITSYAIHHFRSLFPNLTKMSITRSFVIRTFHDEPELVQNLKPLEEVYVTFPLYDSAKVIEPSHATILCWLIRHCVSIERLLVKRSDISLRRAITKKFCRSIGLGNDSANPPAFLSYEPLAEWLALVRDNRDKIGWSNIEDVIEEARLAEDQRVNEEIFI